MSRSWFWPLLLAGILLFSLSAGFVWSIALLYNTPEMPRRIVDYGDEHASVIVHSFYAQVNPVAYVIAATLAAVGALLVIAASRLR
jgi:hypothetical protein